MLADIGNTCLILWDLSRVECASWVQAWGSMFAIGASVWAVNHAHRLQGRQRRQETHEACIDYLEVILQMIGAARQIAGKIYDLELKGNVTPGEYMAMKVELATLDDAMRRIPLERIDGYEFMEAWLVAQMNVRDLLGGVGYVTTPQFSKQLDPYYLRNLANSARQDFTDREHRLIEGIRTRRQAVVK